MGNADRVSCQSWLTYINEDLAARSTMCKCGSALTYLASKVLFLDEGKVDGGGSIRKGSFVTRSLKLS